MVSALSILFQSSMTKCSEETNRNKKYTTAGLVILAGCAVYGIYRYTRPNTPPSPSNDVPQSGQKDKQKPHLIELLGNQQPSSSETPSEDSNSKIEPKNEMPQVNNNQTLSPKPKIGNASSDNKIVVSQEDTLITRVNTQQQTSFSEAICKGYRENATQKLVIDTLLTDHAFSN